MLEPHPRLANRAQKITQLTGEFDREGWNGTGTPRFALNRTESRFDIVALISASPFPIRAASIFCSVTPGEWATALPTTTSMRSRFVQIRMPTMALN